MTDITDTPPAELPAAEKPSSVCEIDAENPKHTIRTYPDGAVNHIYHETAEAAVEYKASVDAQEGPANG